MEQALGLTARPGAEESSARRGVAPRTERSHSEDRPIAASLQELALYLDGLPLPVLSRTDAEVQGYLSVASLVPWPL